MKENNPVTNAIILVVDDSPDSLGMFNLALDSAGYTTLVALSGTQALSILDKIQPDIILLDAVMPEMDGFETCIRIKKILPNIPVIFMTGLSETENIVMGLEAGGVDYVTKPIKPAEVVARIKVHLNNARLSDSARAALDVTGQNLFAIDNDGNMLWSTPQIRNLLCSVPNTENLLKKQLVEAIKSWSESDGKIKQFPLLGFKNALTITYVSEQQRGEHILRVEEQRTTPTAEILEKKLPITKRESEVLLWVSRGKTNWEIAQILNISPRTVNKHLEQIYKKLNVDNRTSAATLSIRVLNTD